MEGEGAEEETRTRGGRVEEERRGEEQERRGEERLDKSQRKMELL